MEFEKSTELTVSNDFLQAAHTYIEDREIIKVLRAATETHSDVIPAIPGFSDDVMTFLHTAAGLAIINRWLAQFEQTLDLLAQIEEKQQYPLNRLEAVARAQRALVTDLGSRAAQMATRDNVDRLYAPHSHKSQS